MEQFVCALISCLTSIHKSGFCHSKVKPEHILIYNNDFTQTTLIGFKSVSFPEKPYYQFMSKDDLRFSAREERKGSIRRFIHDWESLLYCILFALERHLPWDGISNIEEINSLKSSWLLNPQNILRRRINENPSGLKNLNLILSAVISGKNIEEPLSWIIPRRELWNKTYLKESSEMAKSKSKMSESKGCLAEEYLLEYAKSALTFELGIEIYDTERKIKIFSEEDKSAAEALNFVHSECCSIDVGIPQLETAIAVKADMMEINARGKCRLVPCRILKMNRKTPNLHFWDKLNIFKLDPNMGFQNVKNSKTERNLVRKIIPKGSTCLLEFSSKDYTIRFNRSCNERGEKFLVPISPNMQNLQDFVEGKLIMKAVKLEKDLAFTFGLDPIYNLGEKIGICGIVIISPQLKFQDMIHFKNFSNELTLLGECIRRGKMFLFHVESDLSSFLAEHMNDNQVEKHSHLLVGAYLHQIQNQMNRLEEKVELLQEEIKKKRYDQ
jgi:hypothetical protein